MSRWIVVDNSDPSIAFTGNWTTHPNTVQKITGGGSFSYKFQGSQIVVYGGSHISPQVHWNCTVDGASIPNIQSNSTSSGISPKLCNGTLTDSATHILSVNITAGQGHPFYFDYIRYVPSQPAAFDNATIFIESQDSEIKYSQGWTHDQSGLGRTTTVPNTNATFMFKGISLTWLGFQGNMNSTSAKSKATYSIDDQDPVPFDLSPSNGDHPKILSMFTTPSLSDKQHKLVVVYQRPESPATGQPFPLTLSGLIVQNGTAPAPPSPPAMSSATLPNPTTPMTILPAMSIVSQAPESIPTSSPTNPTIQSHHGLSPIAGGVIGGLAIFIALVLLVAAFVFLHRRRKNRFNRIPKTAMTQLRALMPARKSGAAPHSECGASVGTDRPQSPLSDSASSSSSLSYTSRSQYHQPEDSGGYWDAISFGRKTRVNSMVNSPVGTIAENGLLKRPDDLRSPVDSEAQARMGLPSNPAVYREAHRRLQQLLGIGSSNGQANALPSVRELPSREGSGQLSLLGAPLRTGGYVVFEEHKEGGRLN